MSFECDYCKSVTHAVVDCQKRKSDRRMEFAIGCILAAIVFPFTLIGAFCGAARSAFKAGYDDFDDMWPEVWKQIRGKKGKNGEKDDGELG